MSIVNVDTAEINGVDGGTTVAWFDGRIDRWINTRIGGDHIFLFFYDSGIDLLPHNG